MSLVELDIHVVDTVLLGHEAESAHITVQLLDETVLLCAGGGVH